MRTTSARHAVQRALFELAADLRSVPVNERTKRLHLRALELKRMLSTWEEHPPDDHEADAVLEEVQELAVEARRYRDEMRAAIWRVRAPGSARASSPSRNPCRRLP